MAQSIHDQKAEEMSAELLRIFGAMAERSSRAVASAAIAHAVGTYCDRFAPMAKHYMAAEILGIDPAGLKAQIEYGLPGRKLI